MAWVPQPFLFLPPNDSTAPWGPRPPHFEASRSHTLDTPHSVGLLWTSDQPAAETSTSAAIAKYNTSINDAWFLDWKEITTDVII